MSNLSSRSGICSVFKSDDPKTAKTREFFIAIFQGFIMAMIIRTFLYQPFHIPSPSMVPTLLVRDYLFVSKYSYGYSRYSLPFGLNLFQGRVLENNSPERGDVAVFRMFFEGNKDYIKRIIGLPGDRIQLRQGIVYINDEPVKLKRLEDTFEEDNGEYRRVEQYEETLPNGVTHLIQKYQPFGLGRMDNTSVYVVPQGHLFVMGDNRDGSYDSRYERFGYAPMENLIGRAELIFFSTDGSAAWWEFWKWFSAARYKRFFSKII